MYPKEVLFLIWIFVLELNCFEASVILLYLLIKFPSKSYWATGIKQSLLLIQNNMSSGNCSPKFS